MRKFARLGMVGAVAVTLVAGAVTGAWATAARSSAPTKASAPFAPAAGTAAAVTPTTTPETLFVPITPCRIVDTRNAGGALGNGTTRYFHVDGTTGFIPQGGKSGGCGIPAGAVSIAAVLSTINPSGNGYIRAFPYGTAEPSATVAGYISHQGTTAGATLTVTPGSGYGLTAHNFGGPTHLVIDVTGYYVAQIEAYIGGDGSVQTGTSRVVDAVHAGTGFYYIDLDRPVRSCSLTATAYNIYRYASVGYSSSTTPNRVSVYVWYLNGSTPTPEDYPFHLHVSC